MKILLKNFLIFLIIFLILAGVLSLLGSSGAKTEQISVSQLVTEVSTGQVKTIALTGNRLDVVLNNGQRQLAYKGDGDFIALLKNYGVDQNKLNSFEFQVKNSSGQSIWATTILPIGIPLIFIIGFFVFLQRQMRGAGNQAFKFGESQAREIGPLDKKTKITFKDVAGVSEAKSELGEIIEFLKNPRKFINLGAKIPKGVLLVGGPGTGKTLLARAVAGEANVPFFHISGSEFVEMFVGVGASRVRDLFRRAKKNLPCIIFIDEIDAVGRQRGAGLGGSHDEREQTLNQILVELDGFEPNIGLVVMAATNRPDILDPALLRPGRFDRKVILDMPSIKDREEILKIHSQNKPLASTVNLKKVAERTPGFSGADLSNLMNEAAILTARRNKNKIGQLEILESIEKVLLGPERRSRVFSEKEREISAYHEAGHALVAHELPGCDKVQKVSIISRGQAGGYTLITPEEDKYLKNKNEFLDNVAGLLGGFVAEEETFKQTTTGSSSDLKKATDLIKRMVTQFGMSDLLGPRTFGEKEELIFLGREISEQRDYSEKTAQLIDEEVSKLITLCYNKAKEIVKNKKAYLEKIAKLLLEKETLEKNEFEKIFTTP
ncbi:MAG: ATP-dependent zinc metalloprotease FtsH [Patescibacteria group bacterium]|nr:ATP-dependent zinc metalloprotease FtsH [Patescibacteria group bacterium]MDD5121262.1 ATP-dependent zinc metalloprotease FtsH [Patescibacteria group bacterium]MDD5395819.1 ATP-dependent zinc metalloprotease FtsH [Patescibacteria group bacterium]